MKKPTTSASETTDPTEEPQTPSAASRRRALKKLGLSAPLLWVPPVVTSVVLPAHAESSPTSTPITYAIGGPGPCGGIVFFVSNGGLNGLEAAPVDQGSGQWGCFGTATGATGLGIGDGGPNTAAILAAFCGSSTPDAAHWRTTTALTVGMTGFCRHVTNSTSCSCNARWSVGLPARPIGVRLRSIMPASRCSRTSSMAIRTSSARLTRLECARFGFFNALSI